MILNEAQRKASATIGKDRYPIPDKNHAKAALGRINEGHLTHEEKLKVIRKAHAMLKK